MDDIFSHVKEGNAFQVRIWLDNTENDLNQGDDHRFSLLHWACREGRTNIVDMLILRGARINATNMGDDTALHLAASHGHRDIVLMLLHNKANINAINEHGNTPLHYACFWNHSQIAEDLVNNGALVAISNKNNETPLDKAKPYLSNTLRGDATLSRHSGIDISQLALQGRMAANHSGEIWRGAWQGNDIVAKILSLRECTIRNSRDFKEEYPRLRIFNHPNILPVLGACNQPPNLIVISQFMPFGSLYDVLHGETGIVVDQNQALRFALDIARGMEFLHTMEPLIPNLCLSSKHVMIDEDLAKINVDDPKYQIKQQEGTLVNGIEEDLTARINMADYKFSFHEKGKEYNPASSAPEALMKKREDINNRAADMWSYSVLLWELATREVPFAEMSPMEIGMKVALEGLRVAVPPGTSPHMTRLIKICMNEDASKRPRFDMVIPILEKMKQAR